MGTATTATPAARQRRHEQLEAEHRLELQAGRSLLASDDAGSDARVREEAAERDQRLSERKDTEVLGDQEPRQHQTSDQPESADGEGPQSDEQHAGRRLAADLGACEDVLSDVMRVAAVRSEHVTVRMRSTHDGSIGCSLRGGAPPASCWGPATVEVIIRVLPVSRATVCESASSIPAYQAAGRAAGAAGRAAASRSERRLGDRRRRQRHHRRDCCARERYAAMHPRVRVVTAARSGERLLARKQVPRPPVGSG
jgi:hypothetical protein